VLVTDGASPAILVGPEGVFRLIPPQLDTIVNPIGCGDCLAAGFAHQVAHGVDPLAAIRFGMACAAFNCGTLLAGRLVLAEVRGLERGVGIERG
jgi:tagatose 6-phosphate kinase